VRMVSARGVLRSGLDPVAVVRQGTPKRGPGF